MLISMANAESSRISFAKRFAVLLDIRFMVLSFLAFQPPLQPLHQEGQQEDYKLQDSGGHLGRGRQRNFDRVKRRGAPQDTGQGIAADGSVAGGADAGGLGE